MQHEQRYAAMAGLLDDMGALAYGLCGSGSAFFAVFRQNDAEDRKSDVFEAIRGNSQAFQWLRKILFLE
jgi:shikimate kinase